MDNAKEEGKMQQIIVESAANILSDQKEVFLNGVVEVEGSAWPPELQASREKFESRLEVFPQGFIVIKVDGKIKGVTTSEITTYDLSKDKTWDEITDNGMLKRTHNPGADSLYVSSVGVASDAQGMKIGGKLVAAQKALAEKLNLKRLFLGARIPGYDEYCKTNGEVSVEEYLKINNDKGEPVDPEIRFYQRQGLFPAKIVPNFEPDKGSRDYGVVMVWNSTS